MQDLPLRGRSHAGSGGICVVPGSLRDLQAWEKTAAAHASYYAGILTLVSTACACCTPSWTAYACTAAKWPRRCLPHVDSFCGRASCVLSLASLLQTFKAMPVIGVNRAKLFERLGKEYAEFSTFYTAPLAPSDCAPATSAPDSQQKTALVQLKQTWMRPRNSSMNSVSSTA